MKIQGIAFLKTEIFRTSLGIRLGLRVLTVSLALATLPLFGADLGRHASRLRFAETGFRDAAAWSTAAMAGPTTAGRLWAVQTPPYAAHRPMTALQVRASGLPASARVEVSEGESSFVPVRLVNGIGRLPVAVETVGGLRRLRLRVLGGDGMGRLTIGPERSLVLTAEDRFTTLKYVVTDWGTSGDVRVRATDASGRSVGIKSPDGSGFEPDGSGWIWLGRMERGGQAAFSLQRSNDVIYPVTITARGGEDEAVSRVVYAAGPEAALRANPGQGAAGGAPTTPINTYYPVDASMAAGAASIPAGSLQGVSTPIRAGDLLMLGQMQGARIDAINNLHLTKGTDAGGNPEVTITY